LGEEIANAISHGVGLAGALAATPILILTAIHYGTVWTILGASVFGISMVLLYLASTLYHALPGRRVKRLFQILDHSAIYLLIAGTYTPFTFGVLRGSLGWTLFGVVWGLALFGVILKGTGRMNHPWLSTGLYLLMGWLVVLAIHTLWLHLPTASLVWLIAGGLCYTVGVIFYAADHLRYAHFIWHLFVLAGTTCHFFSVLSMQINR